MISIIKAICKPCLFCVDLGDKHNIIVKISFYMYICTDMVPVLVPCTRSGARSGATPVRVASSSDT